MTEGSSLQPAAEEGKTVMYRPTVDGGLEPVTPGQADYRDGLRSRRWNAAPLENPEVEKTDPRIALAAVVGLALVTLVVLIIGYGVGVWSLPA
jgi:hypothetical protein